jgi:hypothetical protein
MRLFLIILLFASINLPLFSEWDLRGNNKRYCSSLGDYSICSVKDRNVRYGKTSKDIDLDSYGRWYAYAEGYNAPFMGGGVFDYQDTNEIDEIGAHTAPWEADNFAVGREANLFMR